MKILRKTNSIGNLDCKSKVKLRFKLRSNKGFSNEFLWAIGFVVVIIIVSVALIAFMVRAIDGQLIKQEFSIRNLAYISNIILSSPGIVAYSFQSEDGLKSRIQYEKSHVSLASSVEILNDTLKYSNPSLYLHPFPVNYSLDNEEFYYDKLFLTHIKNNLIVSSSPINNLECSHYLQFNSFLANKILIYSEEREEVNEKLELIKQRLGDKVDTEFVNGSSYDNYDIIIILDKIHNKSKDKSKSNQNNLNQNQFNQSNIILSTPSIPSKKLGCILSEHFSFPMRQGELDNDIKNSLIEQAKIIIQINLRDYNEFDPIILSTAISRFNENG